MSNTELTFREQEYLDCETPMVSRGTAVGRVITGMLSSLLQAAFLPGSDKADRKLMRTMREIRYTKFKKAVLRKAEGNCTEKDKKTLKKLNKQPFILDIDTFDADRYTQELYEEYMKKHNNSEE